MNGFELPAALHAAPAQYLPSGSPSTVHGYAEQLIGYIGDDSTVRVRVLERFGRAPSRDWIAARRAGMRERDEGVRERRQLLIGEPLAEDGLAFAPSSRSFAAVVSQWVREEEERRRPGRAAEVAELERRRNASLAQRVSGDVLATCAAIGGVSVAQLTGRDRARRITGARHLAIVLLVARGNSISRASQMVGGRDHSTGCNALRKFFDRDRAARPELAEAFARLAPCVIGIARTYEEFRALAGLGQVSEGRS